MTQSCSSTNSSSNKSYSSFIPRFMWPAVPKHTCLSPSPPLVSSFTTASAYPFPSSSSPPPPLPTPIPPNRQRTTSTSSIDTIRNFSTLDELIQFYGQSEPPSAGIPVKSKRKQCNRSKSLTKAKQRKAKRISSPPPTTTCFPSVLHSDHRTESEPATTPEVGAGTVPNCQGWVESSTPVEDDASASNCDSQSPWSPLHKWDEIDPFVSSPAKPQFDRNSGFDHVNRKSISGPLNGHDNSPIHMHHASAIPPYPTVDDFELSIAFLQQPHFEFWDKNDVEHVVCPAQLHLTLKDPHDLHDLHLHHKGQQSIPTSPPDIQVIDIECFNRPVPSLLTDHDPDSNYRITYIGSTTRDDRRGVCGDNSIPKDVVTKPGICIDPNWSRLHFNAGWFMKLWVPIPTRLFAKKETREFTLRSRLWIGKEDEEPDAVVGERVMTVSHLLREREMI